MSRPTPPLFSTPTPTAVFASGGGRTFENLVHLARSGDLPLDICCLVADRESAGALERAAQLNVEALLHPWSRTLGAEAWSKQVFEELEARGVELVLLGGFLRLLRVPRSFSGRVLNIHPSLLPSFGGKGFFGDHVHRAVLESGATETGCSVHLVDDAYDEGPVIYQRSVAVLPDDTVASLAGRVFEAERIAFPEAVREWVTETQSTPAASPHP